MNSKYMDEAIKEAKAAAKAEEVPVGAVVVLNGEVIASEHNRCEELSDPTEHAEMRAIRSACKKIKNFRLNGAQIYVTMEPCPMCAGAIISARISEVVFGAYDPVKGALGSVCNLYENKFPVKAEIFSGVREKECKEILTEFFKKQRQMSAKE